jgi:superfamily II DNA or RNA helicase
MLSSLRTKNPDRDVAIREKLWNAESLPEEIQLFHLRGDDLALPRGFLHAFTRGMALSGVEVEWDDNRRWYDYFPLGATKTPQLRDYQEPAVEALIKYEQGVYEAPTGAGKTEVAIEAIRKVSQPTIIIVDRATLAQQWVERIESNLGCPVGYIGEEEHRIEPITVALRQALWAQLDVFEAETVKLGHISFRSFFDAWAAVIVDEVHHQPCQTMQELVQRFSARYRWGFSATPVRDPLTWPITRAIIGPILHQTAAQDAGGSLVTPSVRVLVSDFTFDYEPTRMVFKVDAETGEPILNRAGNPIKIRKQNNYSELLHELSLNSGRTTLIADEVVCQVQEEHHVLIVSRRKKHLEHLYKLLCVMLAGEEIPVQMLLGGEPGERKAEVQEIVEQAAHGSVLLSTVADEGLDIPRLDRVFLIFPARNPETVKQIIGRIMRPHPGKTDAIVVDVWDKRVGLLSSQFRDRRQQLYLKSGYQVEFVERQAV